VTHVVVDTNVLVVANGSSSQADDDCEVAAANRLQEILRSKVVVVDTEYLAIVEYSKNASWAGGPGVGDLFFKVLTDNIANPLRVSRIDIGASQEEIDMLIPNRLLDFDSDDRKWIALYLEASAESIVNATDSDWSARKSDLVAEGINVLELCANCLIKRRATGV